MWKKAEHILSVEGSVTQIPWSSDTKARLVMSESSDHPHVVMISALCLKITLYVHMFLQLLNISGMLQE